MLAYTEQTSADYLRRSVMVEEQIERRGISDVNVLSAMRRVPRHLFVDESMREKAYEDRPLPIGYGQTISQPYIVAYMTQAACLTREDKVLEIGTGSGYQTAILAEIAKEVYTVELIKPLIDITGKRFRILNYRAIKVKEGDGHKGWHEFAPFDVIIVTAAPREIPETLVDQLKMNGRMVVPIGSIFQELYVLTKTDKEVQKEKLLPVKFVPMVKP